MKTMECGMKTLWITACLVLFTGMCANAQTMWWGWQGSVNGNAIAFGDVPLEDQEDGSKTVMVENLADTDGDWLIEECMMNFDPDPFINYSLAVENTSGGDLNFSFTYTLVFNPPINDSVLVDSTFQGGFTDGGDNDIHVNYLDPGVPEDGSVTEMHVVNISHNGGATLYNVGMDLGVLPASGSGGGSFGYSEAGPQLIGPPPAGQSWNFLRIDVNFTLSGEGDDTGDILTASGSADVLDANPGQVPVPAALWLFGSGLFGLAALRGKLR